MFIHINGIITTREFDIIMLRIYPNKTIKYYMLFDRVILRLCHDKTLHEGRCNHCKITSQENII